METILRKEVKFVEKMKKIKEVEIKELTFHQDHHLVACINSYPSAMNRAFFCEEDNSIYYPGLTFPGKWDNHQEMFMKKIIDIDTNEVSPAIYDVLGLPTDMRRWDPIELDWITNEVKVIQYTNNFSGNIFKQKEYETATFVKSSISYRKKINEKIDILIWGCSPTKYKNANDWRVQKETFTNK